MGARSMERPANANKQNKGIRSSSIDIIMWVEGQRTCEHARLSSDNPHIHTPILHCMYIVCSYGAHACYYVMTNKEGAPNSVQSGCLAQF